MKTRGENPCPLIAHGGTETQGVLLPLIVPAAGSLILCDSVRGRNEMRLDLPQPKRFTGFK